MPGGFRMDARHFDHLARSLSAASPRRGLLALLAALPVLGGLLALLDPDEAEARKNRRKNRRKTRKKPHKRAKRRRQKRKQRKKQKCKAKSRARICANRCGMVKNNCGKKVACGSCVCDPTCKICETCNDRTGVCEPDPAKLGQDCGQPGQICQADGACTCDPSSCSNPTPLCVEGACLACTTSEECDAAGVGTLCCDG